MKLLDLIRQHGISCANTNTPNKYSVDSQNQDNIPILSDLNQKTTDQIFSTIKDNNNTYLSALTYILLDLRIVFPNLKIFETDEVLTRFVMNIPDSLESLMKSLSSQCGHTVPLMLGLKDKKIVDRLVVLNDLLSKDSFDASEFLDKCGISESLPNNLLKTVNEEFG